MGQWNQFNTGEYEGVIAEVTTYEGGNGDMLHTYFARPMGAGPFPGIVLIHHLPGWDEFYRETARRFAAHGYSVMMPDLYCRFGHGSPDDVAAKVRGEGGVADQSVIDDCAAASRFLRALPTSNGKVGVIGSCSGGRHAYLCAGSTPEAYDALVDLWGGRVVMQPNELNPKNPVSPVDLTKNLSMPVLGIFGNDDQNPNPEMVNQIEEALKKEGKNYEFHRYDGAGHGIFYYQTPLYRQQQAMDGWSKVYAFFDKNLAS